MILFFGEGIFACDVVVAGLEVCSGKLEDVVSFVSVRRNFVSVKHVYVSGSASKRCELNGYFCGRTCVNGVTAGVVTGRIADGKRLQIIVVFVRFKTFYAYIFYSFKILSIEHAGICIAGIIHLQRGEGLRKDSVLDFALACGKAVNVAVVVLSVDDFGGKVNAVVNREQRLLVFANNGGTHFTYQRVALGECVFIGK